MYEYKYYYSLLFELSLYSYIANDPSSETYYWLLPGAVGFIIILFEWMMLDSFSSSTKGPSSFFHLIPPYYRGKVVYPINPRNNPMIFILFLWLSLYAACLSPKTIGWVGRGLMILWLLYAMYVNLDVQ